MDTETPASAASDTPAPQCTHADSTLASQESLATAAPKLSSALAPENAASQSRNVKRQRQYLKQLSEQRRQKVRIAIPVLTTSFNKLNSTADGSAATS